MLRAEGVERQQLRLFVATWVLLALGLAAVAVLGLLLGLPNSLARVPLELALAGIPLAAGIALVKYRLYELDVWINRGLVYASLSLTIVGVYVGMVETAGVLFRSGDNLAISLSATCLVALLLQPVRQRVQGAVNRLMYGDRDQPYSVLSRLGQRLEGTLAPEAVLPTIVETVARVLKLPYAAIALRHVEDFDLAAVWGSDTGEALRLPLVYQHELVGQLMLGPRSPGESFDAADRRLLTDLARHAGVAAHAVRLTAELQRARERLVLAREEERRRLRRDLHDGLGPRLAALTLKLETARNRMRHEPLPESFLTEIAGQIQEAIADIRRLVNALRPPALDELGLVSALREIAAEYGLFGAAGPEIVVVAPEDLPPLPAAVEVAAYRIAQEALTNVVRHAAARRCLVRLSSDGRERMLHLEIRDDGRCLSAEPRQGVGLSSMRERAAELGGTCAIEADRAGGTSVRAVLPWSIGREDGQWAAEPAKAPSQAISS